MEYTNLALGISFILLVILVGNILAKRNKMARQRRSQPMNIIQSLALSTKEKMILLEVNQQKILVGVTPHQLTTLHVFQNQTSDFESQMQWSQEKNTEWQAELQ